MAMINCSKCEREFDTEQEGFDIKDFKITCYSCIREGLKEFFSVGDLKILEILIVNHICEYDFQLNGHKMNGCNDPKCTKDDSCQIVQLLQGAREENIDLLKKLTGKKI